jgi:hypothetical protein
MGKEFQQQLIDAVSRSGMTRYAISKVTRIPQSQLSRFIHGQEGLSMESVNKLCKLLDLRLVGPAKKKTKTKGK